MTKSEEFYVSLNVECNEKVAVINKVYNKDNLKVVGLDMSLQHFCVSSDPSDDAITKYIREYRKEEKRIARLQRRMSRRKSTVEKEVDGEKKKTEGSNHRKARLRLARKSERISRRRREFCIKMARYFAMKYDVVCIEDINMQAMSRSLHLGKSVMDLGWGMLRRWLEYECEKYDTVVYKVDKWYPSSKTCHCCGHVNKDLKLSDREWVCPHCGATIDRDRNAAMNLRDCFVNEICTAGTVGINARGNSASTLRGTVEQVLSSKREGSSRL
jgi:putative transposase